MSFFRIIIPNYNNAEWLDKCLSSVMSQTYKDYKVVVVDDMSTDNSIQIIERYPVELLRAEKKAFNGGARNIGIRYPIDSVYTLFLDSDDWFDNDQCLQTVHDALKSTAFPDCMTLSYKWLVGNQIGEQTLNRNDRKNLVDSVFVACWTKCIKSEKIVGFPENTLMEDVVQHIAQADVCETFSSILLPMVVWNRNNKNSCSRNQNLKKGKWQSSMYRYCADLMDLKCNTPECEAQRKWRLNVVLNNIKQGKYI